MGLVFDWIDKLKRYAKFKPGELNAGIITVIVIAFAISFGKWGIGKQVDISDGLTNLLLALIIVSISFFGRTMFQKIVSLGADYLAEYKMWSYGLLITLLLAFISNGLIWFLVPGSIIIHYMPGNRIGWVRYGLNHFGIGVISLAGPIGNIILAMIFRTLFSIFHVGLFKTAMIFNIIWALWTIIPIPPTDGSRMFFGSRMVYMFALAVIVSTSAFLLASWPVIITIPVSILVGFIWWLIYYIVWERFNWKGPY